MFARLGRWCHDHRRAVIVLWVASVILGGVVLGVVGKQSKSQFELPNVESKKGSDILDANFGGQGAGFGGNIVFRADRSVKDPSVKGPMTKFLAAVDDIPKVTVSSPYAPGGERQTSQRGATAGKLAFADVELPNITNEQASKIRDKINARTPHIEGVDIELGGEVFADFQAPSSEALGLAFAVVILLLAFGSVLAMGLPVGVALAGIAVGSIVAGLLSHLVAAPDFASILGVMIGLGVGIDYALFIVTRFRENMHNGHDVRRSTIIAIDTAGRAVLFAGTTVCISLLGMIIMGMSFVTGLAVSAAAVVAITMVASLTLLPALLGFAGSKVEVTRWRGLLAAGLVALALVGAGLGLPAVAMPLVLLAVITLVVGIFWKPLKRQVPRRERPELRRTFAYRWSRVIQHHPWRAVIGGLVVLLVLASPILALRLGFSDEGNYPKDTPTKKAYDLLAEGFGPGFNGPLILASDAPRGGTDQGALQRVQAAVAKDPGVAFASPAITSPNKKAVLWRIIPTTAPQAEKTTKLVDRLRTDVLPQATKGSGLAVSVTGSVAIGVDFSKYLASRLPWFLGAVLTLSFVLLMVVFRSVLVPLKAVIMNLLSIGAAYGVIVAAFQWGWAGPLLHIGAAPIEPFMPMMLFAIVFGLSMDYEVFLLSRVKEEWDHTGDSRLSVADGLAATARVITAAALIMVFVFGSFLLENQRTIRLFGLGLATAVFLDATIVRMVLVPATMELLGDRNWWVPRWLDRILPHIEVEGRDVTDEEPELTEPELERV
ncbi:MAG: MMPL family transporter [Acidimicrobiia bacterium]|nr:MMPL family transporter [Acidimicrobiia bacterium]